MKELIRAVGELAIDVVIMVSTSVILGTFLGLIGVF